MSDLTADRTQYWDSAQNKTRIRRRHRVDLRLQIYGLVAIGLTILLLGVFLGSIIFSGYQAFRQTKINVTLNLTQADIPAGGIEKLNFREVTAKTLDAMAPPGLTPRQLGEFRDIFSSEVRFVISKYIQDNPEDVIGRSATFLVPVSDPFDQLYKGIIPSTIPALSNDEMAAFRTLAIERGLVNASGERPAIRLDLYIDPAKVPADNPSAGAYNDILQERLRTIGLPESVLASDAADILKQHVIDNPSAAGKTLANFSIPLSANYAILARGEIPTTHNPRFASAEQIRMFQDLVEAGQISSPFNWELVTNPDSRFPEIAGLSGAIVGSFYALLVCFLISFPVGIAAAVYLEEFAPKNRWTDLIEVNINNLAAVPSIVFGLLGLALFLNTFGLPRSAPLVGGMVLALMTLPTIIVATRAALKAVPPSIREAALGVGASNYQVVMHHVLPLAMPGILTGTIIGLAQALGETAPLLLIGMNAFISAAPGGILDPATSLPTQIFSWADSPERGFVSRTAAGIMVLLGFLVLMNLIAIYLRQRFEKKW